MIGRLVAAALAAGASSALAAPTATPAAMQSYTSNSGAKWEYSNCQSDLAYGNRALPCSLDIASKTVESCLDACSKAGYALCGVEYYGECWGGNALDKTSTGQDESACNLACRDNSLQLCGGTGGSTSATMNLYKRTNVPVAPAPIVPKVVQNYTSSGGTKWGYSNCQSDLAYGNRALGASLATVNRTVQACLEACSKTEYKLCGVEYYGECWAGNELDKTSTAQAESACGLACADDASQLCGGVGGNTNAAMNLYKRASVATSPVSSNNSTNTTTTPAAPTKYKADSNWAYKGCYTDSLLDDGRSLPNLITAANWSPQACLTAAKSKGYAVAGLTYGGECWAGNAISTAAVKKNDTTCDWTCNDARSFTCGSDKLVDIYISTTEPFETVPSGQTKFGNWSYDSCYSDSTSARSLPMQLDNPKGNIEGCLAACAAVNATTCGLEWYGECFASTTGFQNGAAKIDQSKCSTPCRSDSSQMCGGSNALSIYKFSPPQPQPGTPIEPDQPHVEEPPVIKEPEPEPTPVDESSLWRYVSCSSGGTFGAAVIKNTKDECLAWCRSQNIHSCAFESFGATGHCREAEDPDRSNGQEEASCNSHAVYRLKGTEVAPKPVWEWEFDSCSRSISFQPIINKSNLEDCLAWCQKKNGLNCAYSAGLCGPVTSYHTTNDTQETCRNVVIYRPKSMKAVSKAVKSRVVVE